MLSVSDREIKANRAQKPPLGGSQRLEVGCGVWEVDEGSQGVKSSYKISSGMLYCTVTIVNTVLQV